MTRDRGKENHIKLN